MNLVLQGPSLDEVQAREAAGMVRAGHIEPVSAGAFRLRNVSRNEHLAAWCEERRIDHAWMPAGRRFADLRLVAMDMDSTLITIECIDELGDMAGCKPAIAGITARAMRGEIDYKQSLRERVRLLAGLDEAALLRVYDERLKLSPGAEVLLGKCKEYGVKLLLVSGGFTFYTERLKARLGIDYTISNTLEVHEGRLTGGLVGDIVDADAKAVRFAQVMNELKTPKEQTVAIGDGANDLKMMALAGVSVAFHAKPVVRAQATCALTWCGLDGVVHLFE